MTWEIEKRDATVGPPYTDMLVIRAPRYWSLLVWTKPAHRIL